MANKQPKLTMAQVYTLRRISSGTSYSLRADGNKAHENREEIVASSGRWGLRPHPVNAPSIPVLYRLGLIEFTTTLVNRETKRYYRIQLTAAGYIAMKANKERTE